MMLNRFAVLLASGIALFSIQGCGGKSGLDLPTGTVAGKVTLKGAPIQDASVTFFGENHGDSATAPLQADGTYTLKYGTGFAVPIGDYRVAIVPGPPAGSASPDPADLMKTMIPAGMKASPIPDKYRDPKTSGLIAVVKEGSNANLDFDLK